MGSRQRTNRVAGAVLAAGLAWGGGAGTRAPAVAGDFYPSDASRLTGEVDRLVAAVTQPAAPANFFVVPHAGYAYSGPVAARAYAALKGTRWDRVVIIAPTHVEAFDFTSVFDGDSYSTPLGVVPVDRVFSRRLAKAHPSLRLSPKGHLRNGARGEHAIEVQLPFLQRAIGDFTLVPVVIGAQTYENCRALGIALASLTRGSKTLILASSDLSHYHPYGDAVVLDRRVLQAVQNWDYLALSTNLDAGTWEACGGGPVIALMIAAERAGAARADLLYYANSGDMTTERSRVVGYSAIAFRPGPPSTPGIIEIDEADRQALLRLARVSVESAVRRVKMSAAGADGSSEIKRALGTFVTLKRNGELRGCVGSTAASKPLNLAIRDLAALAALRDPRFAPVTLSELADLRYEISVLSPLRRIANPDQVEVGKHGLLIRQAGKQGLLLPQVALEGRFSRVDFLRQVSLKAGLDQNAWRSPQSDIFVFTAQIFGDE